MVVMSCDNPGQMEIGPRIVVVPGRPIAAVPDPREDELVRAVSRSVGVNRLGPAADLPLHDQWQRTEEQ